MSGSPWLRAGHEGRSDLVTSGGMINQRHRAAPIIGGGEATLLAVISTSAQKSAQKSSHKSSSPKKSAKNRSDQNLYDH